MSIVVEMKAVIRLKIKADSKIRTKTNVWIEPIFLVSLSAPFKPENLDYICLGEAKLNTELLKDFFLFNAILLTLTKIFLNKLAVSLNIEFLKL